MPIYQYQSADGRTIDRYYCMRDEKPERIVDGRVEYRRVFSAPAIAVSKGHEVQIAPGSRLPISRSVGLRKDGIVRSERHGREVVNTHADGMKTDGRGRPIIANRKDRDRVKRWARGNGYTINE